MTVSVDYECTLLLAVLSDTPTMVELSVSKLFYFLCRDFIITVQAHYRACVMLSREACCCVEIACCGATGLDRAHGESVRDEMDEVLEHATRNSKLNSVSMGSWP